MSTHLSQLRVAVPSVVAGCLLALLTASVAEAKAPKTVPADLRVVDAAGKTLAEHTQYTVDSVRIKTDRKADCLGEGTGGSGRKTSVPGVTALGQLSGAQKFDRDLRPLSVSDYFDFGLAICGIGKAISPSTGFWYLKINHVASPTGGDQTILSKNDEALWYLIDDYMKPTPDELVIKAPNRVKRGEATQIRVLSYDGNGTRSRAADATVKGADAPTDAQGHTTITPTGKLLELRATRAGSIPSERVVLCTVAAAKCPPGYAKTVVGTKRADRIKASRAAEKIVAGAGRDKINARQGTARDLINCGPGKDRVVLARGQKPRLKGCEKVVRVRR